MNVVKNSLVKIAIVGSMGSGKSYVLNYFKSRDFLCINCDDLVANLYQYYSPLILDLQNLNSELVVNDIVDKKQILNIFIHDKYQKKLIEKIVFKHIYEILNLIFLNIKGVKYCFVEVPLLFESDGAKYFDEIIYIDRFKELRFESLRNSRGYSNEWLNLQNSFLMDEDFKKENSTIVIDNNHGFLELESQLEKIIERLYHEYR